jgi:tRNA (cmo5U34)-methyltransferase
MPSGRDTLYQTLADPGLFTFNEEVVGVFPDMIKRSVPGYSTIIAMSGLLAGKHARDNTRIYDLGCSLGASLLAAAQHVQGRPVQLVGIDNSPAMIEGARQNIAAARVSGQEIDVIEGDIATTPLSNASVVLMNFTLQFVPVAQRIEVLKRIHGALTAGDILVLSEKIKMPTPAMDDYVVDLHHTFKRAQGYSELEIARKRQALENVMVTEDRETHIDRLQQAGFQRADIWFQCFNFASFVAVA